MKDVPVLIVDDRADNILAAEAVLEPLEVEVLRAQSGADALRVLLTREVAVILLDVQMPDLDGFETARHIKERTRTRHIPIIFLTAISRELEQQLKGYGAGAVDYLSKPFEPDVLRSKVTVFAELYRNRKLIEEQNALLADRLSELETAQASLAQQAAELERSNAELERLGTLASHELREPLFIVDGFLELLKTRHADEMGENATALLDRARKGARRMIDKVDQVLDFARVSGGAMATGAVDLNAVLARARTELAPLVTASAATFVTDPLPEVQGDQWQLERLFVHLVDNAIRYRGDEAPVVTVTVARQRENWVISVRDNGRGIDPADLPRLFTPLSPGGSATTQLGLAVCHRVVERHGGTIWAESPEGRGTEVSFTLPARPA